MQHKKKALITGARSGIGFELTRRMLQEGWHIIALNRSAFAEDDELIRDSIASGTLMVYLADLSDFSSLFSTLKEISRKEEYLDIIFNNAGSMSGSLSYSPQGREIDFEINTVVPYIIYKELEPLLLKGSLKTVVNTSSEAALRVKKFHPGQLEKPVSFEKLFGVYASSKLALSLWTQALALNFTNGIKIRSADPGPIKTPMTKSSGMPWFVLLLRPFIFSHPRKGAAKLYDAAFGEYNNANGVFISKGKVRQLKSADNDAWILSKIDRIYRNEILTRRP